MSFCHSAVGSTQQDADEIFHIILNLSQNQMPDVAVVGFCIQYTVSVNENNQLC